MVDYSNSLEGGTNGTTITTGNSASGSGDAFTALSGTSTFSTSAAYHGSLGFQAPTTAAAGYFYWDVSSTSNIAARLYFRPAGVASSDDYLIRLGNGTTRLVSVHVNAAGKLRVSDAAGTTGVWTAASALTANTWYRLDLYAVAGSTTSNGTIKFGYYLGDSTSPVETVYNNTSSNVGTATTFNRAYMGKYSAVSAFGYQFDDFKVRTAASDFIGPVANTPPTVDAGVTQNVSAGTVNLSFTASDPDGTIASIATTYVSASSTGSPSITGGTTLTPSFTAGSAPQLYTVQATVTDNGGATASDTVEIRVPVSGATTMVPLALNGSGTGTWTIGGGSGTEGAAMADSSDSTYVESPTVTGSETNRRWRLAPSATKASGSFVVRMATDSGTANTTVRLYEGGTLRQSWTQALTTTITDYTFSLSSGTVSAITDWGNVFYEVGATT